MTTDAKFNGDWKTESLELRDELAAYKNAPVAAYIRMKTITYNPETHVLVPREPSDEMLRKAIKVDLGKDCDEKGICINLYQVMLAAAPQTEPNREKINESSKNSSG